MARMSLMVMVACAVTLAVGAARADEPERDLRPIRYASLEVNPVGMLSARYGGQLQVGLIGPVSLVGGMSHIHLEDDQNVGSSADLSGVAGGPDISGWHYELGPRFYVPVHAGRSGRVDLVLAPSYTHDDLRQGGILSCNAYSDKGPPPGQTCGRGPATSVTRDGFALDGGFVVTLPFHAYALLALGFEVRTRSLPYAHAGYAALFLYDNWERETVVPRLRFSLGWGL